MAWDWDAEDIDPDKDDGRAWVPAAAGGPENEGRQETPQDMVEDRWEPGQEMVEDGPEGQGEGCRATQPVLMYPVTNGPGGVIQEQTPIPVVMSAVRGLEGGAQSE